MTLDARIEKLLFWLANVTQIDFNDPSAAWDDPEDVLNDIPDAVVEARAILTASGKEWRK